MHPYYLHYQNVQDLSDWPLQPNVQDLSDWPLQPNGQDLSDWPLQPNVQYLSDWPLQPNVQKFVESPGQFNSSQNASLSSRLANFRISIIEKDPSTISNLELKKVLTNIRKEFDLINDTTREQTLSILADCIHKISGWEKAKLLTVIQHNFFSSLSSTLTDLLDQWRQSSSMSDGETNLFRAIVKLIKRSAKAMDDTKLLSAWWFESKLINSVAYCLTDVANSEKFTNDQNIFPFRSFTGLIKTYTDFQQHLNNNNNFDKDKLVLLLDPVIKCLTSSIYINYFNDATQNASKMKVVEKFYLFRCPSIFTSYKGSRLESITKSLLSTMLPQYSQILNKIIPSASNWNQSTISVINSLLQIINHGSDQFQANATIFSQHLSLIDNLLKLVNEPSIYNNIQQTLSNAETNLIYTVTSFLQNMINEPTILAHIKQAGAASVFLRFTSCPYAPIALNANNLLAYTTRQEDIKAMENPGELLKINLKSIRTVFKSGSPNSTAMEKLLETLKGLVQHDEMKDQIINQNKMGFLLQCADKLDGRSHALIMEILWSLSFQEQGAAILRADPKFINQIQSISKTTDNEQMKKTFEGLTWKLIDEPALLKRREKQEAEDKNRQSPDMITVTEEIVNSDGTKELVTVTKPAPHANRERHFKYDMMISYCHADKDLIYKIHQFLLDQGFLIWIDLNNMFGPAMSAMADAVENSEFVLLCMSDSYKNSTYCQAEAEYAFGCKRRLVPLIARPGYRADGWLGFMIGSRIYIDFGAFDFDTACTKLVAEISRQSQRPLPSKAAATIGQTEKPPEPVKPVIPDETKPASTAKNESDSDKKSLDVYKNRKPKLDFTKKHVNEWNESDVLDFLFTQKFIELMPLCELFDGKSLMKLYKMCKSHSTQTYTFLNDELTSTFKIKLSFGLYIRFVSAMEQKLAVQGQIMSRRVKKANIQTIVDACPPEAFSNDPNQEYDLLVYSDAPSIHILKALEHYGLNINKSLKN